MKATFDDIRTTKIAMRIRDAYIIAFQTEKGNWFEFQPDSVELSLIPESSHLPYKGNYSKIRVACEAEKDFRDIRFDYMNFKYSVFNLARHDDDDHQKKNPKWKKATARALLQIIVQVSEVLRFTDLQKYFLRGDGWPVPKEDRYLKDGSNTKDDKEGSNKQGSDTGSDTKKVKRGPPLEFHFERYMVLLQSWQALCKFAQENESQPHTLLPGYLLEESLIKM